MNHLQYGGNQVGKVKYEYHYDVVDQETNEGDTFYVLLDVADDEEGYGVVVGNWDTDETIAFGFGELNLSIAYMLFESIQEEIKNRIRIKGSTPIYMDEDFDFHYLESTYDWDTKEASKTAQMQKNLIRIMEYITKYSPLQKEEL